MVDIWHYKFRFSLALRDVNWSNLKGLFDVKHKNLIKKTAYHKGRTKGSKLLVRQKRSVMNHLLVKDNVSMPFFKMTPSLAVGMAKNLQHGKTTTLLVTSSNVSFFSQEMNFSLFYFYFFDFWKLHSKFPSVISDKWFMSIKLGSKLTNVRSYVDLKPLYSKAVGSWSKLLSYEPWAGTYLVKLPSGSFKFFLFLSMASIFNPNRNLFIIQKKNYLNAGNSMKLGRRPKVRGVAMNPVDHPHGGRTKSIKFHRTPWGLSTK